MTTARNAVLLSLAAAGAALTLFASRGTPALVEVPTPAARVALAWDGATRHAYTVEVDSAVEVAGRAGARYRHRLTGRLHLQVFRDTDEGLELGWQLADIVQAVDGAPCPDPLLETFFTTRAERSGRLVSFDFPKSLDQAHTERLRALLSLFQIVVPSGTGDSWTTEEADAQGRFRAVYRQVGAHLRKARVEYLSGDVKVLASSTSALPDRECWLATCTADETQTARGPDGQRITVKTHARLERAGIAPLWADPPATRLARAAQTAQHTKETMIRSRQRSATAEDRARLLALIDELDRTGKLGNRLMAIRALLDECPELADLFPELIRAEGRADRTAATLIHALKLSGHERAQGALVRILGDPQQAAANRLRAVIDLGGVAHPVDASCDALWQSAAQRATDSELANTAMLALGRVGHSLHRSGDARYAAFGEQLRNALHAAPSDVERVNVLTALGNTGDASFASEVQGHLQADSPQERGAAAKALGRMPGTAGALVTALRGEASPFVRGHLAEGLVQQGVPAPETLRAVEAAIPGERDARARLAMARVLGENLAAHPTGRDTLERLLAGESNNRIRQYVAGKLYAK
ncbi:MAG: HEAT repeat domain-containing protein [Planctomycetes bacterium]|nr:HEAT repeat domain-containing protein [Planctomycetota bacterium]